MKLRWLNGEGVETKNGLVTYEAKYWLESKDGTRYDLATDDVKAYFKANGLTTCSFRGGNENANTKAICDAFGIPMDKESILKAMRKAKGLTQIQLSNMAGIPFRTIQDLEADKVMHITTTRADYLYRISKALGCRMEDFMNRCLDEAIIKLYYHMDMDISSVENDMANDYLTENDGWYEYYDGVKEGRINISTLKIDDEIQA